MHGEPASRVKHYLDIIKGSNAEIFENFCPSPVLVVLGGIIQPGSDFVTRATGENESLHDFNGKHRFDPNARVFPVIKSEGANPYSQMIIIGRTHNTDIQLHSSSISKMHAFITWQDGPTGRQYKIADGKSRNGTWLGTTRLQSQKVYPLSSGTTIGLGGTIFMRFYLPGNFYTALTAMAFSS